jgi:Glyoxalase-like domain
MTQYISRRFFLAGTAAATFASRSALAEDEVPPLLDHILLGCNDLDRGIDFVYQHTGVRAAFGGVHPGAGTQNALLSLGENRYLEIIAPDPKQPDGPDTRNLRSLDDDPAVVGWAAHHADLDGFAAKIRNEGFAMEGPIPGSRKRPDGRVLTWKVIRLKKDPTQLLPFFIEWSAGSVHPSVDSPHGCRLVRFEAFAPYEDSQAIDAQIKELGLDLSVAPGKKIFLAATIIGPKGEMRVTS